MTEAISPGAAPARQLCVVVPTFKERDNVPKLFAKLDAALSGIAWEVVFVDDNSPDGTWDVATSWPRPIPAFGVFAGSAGAGFRAPASRVSWPRARPMSR